MREPVIPALATEFTVVAPDLRGLGRSSRPQAGYTAGDIAGDILALMDALQLPQASVVGIDLGTPASFLLGMRHPQRVRKLVLMEALVGSLPGAEQFLKAGPPWWFGFHAVPGLAESVLEGQEERYLDFFLDAGTLGDGVQPNFARSVRTSYRGRNALRAAFEHYRSLPASSEQIALAAAEGRLTMSTLTIGARPVGEATHRQVEPIADELSGMVLRETGHIIPQHRPEELARALLAFLR